MSDWMNADAAPQDEDLLVKRDIGSCHVAMLLADGRWVDWYCNEIKGVVGWKTFED